MRKPVYTLTVVLAVALVASLFIACGGGGGGGSGGTTLLTLAGTVTDVDDVVAEGVKVTVINGDTGVSTGLSTVSAADGSYSIEDIPSGQAFYVNMEGTGYVPTNTENHVLTVSELGADVMIVDSTTADDIVPLVHPTGSVWADVEGTTGFIAVELYKTDGDYADGYFLRPDSRLNMLGFNDGTDDYSGSGIVTHVLPADSAPMVMGYEEVHADKLYTFEAQGCSTVYSQDAWVNTGEVTIMTFYDLEDACPPANPKLGITADRDDSTVSFFNAETMESVGTTDAQCGNPFNIVMAADGSEAYVICRNSPSVVSIVSMSTQSVIDTVVLSGDQAYNGAVAPDGYLYVAYDDEYFVSKVLISGGTPAEASTIGIANYGGPVVATPDGNYLYVGSHGYDNLSKIDVASGTEIDNWAPGYSYIWDMALDTDGRLYLGAYDEYEIPIWNTVNDSLMATPLPTGVDEVANEFVLDGTELFISNGLDSNLDLDGTALTILDTGLTWDDYDYYQADDDYYTVSLPFTFNFLGTAYTEAYPGSNGHLDFNSSTAAYYDTIVGNITGFAPFMEDLSSDYGFFNFSNRLFADHVVFSWYTASYDTYDLTTGVCVFEVVLFDDDTARMDYLACGADSFVSDDDGSTYGVGDGSGTDVVDLRAAYGSPFELERRSFLWDPAVSTTSLTEVPFQWEGTGADHLPLVNHAHGLALTDDYVFMVMSKDGYWSDTSVNIVEVYNRATMLPAGQITVGYGPRAIAVQP